MRTTWKWLPLGLALTLAAPLRAEEPKADAGDPPLKAATSRVVSVTVYQTNALVTRAVTVSEGKGLAELIVTPLPPETIDSSLYTEGTDGLRVLSTRYRTRAVKEDTRKEVRAKEEEIKKLKQDAERMQKDVQVIEQNQQLLTKLEAFTGVTMQHLAEKGLLDSKATLSLAGYIMETRADKSKAQVELQQKLQANTEAVEFASRELEELTAGASRTERDAVIVVDRANAQAGTVRLNYLVSSATWHPQYRVRAGAEKDPVQLEYLAAVEQQTGEDWNGVDMTLSTAQPQLNATPPELLALDLTVMSRAAVAGRAGQPGPQGQSGMMMGGMGGMGGGMGLSTIQRDQFRAQSRQLREKAQQELIVNKAKEGGESINEAAALEQAEELLARRDEDKDEKAGADKPELGKPVVLAASAVTHEGPSVTYHLRSKLTVPSRNDQQLIEVARIELKPDYYYKAVPVLTTHVYRLAELTNKSEYVLLPGEAVMYVGSDFVGRMNLPLVAIGEQFTAGFGVDPQLQAARVLVKKSRSVQGGNQVHSYEYRITISSYKPEPAKVQVWDRLPKAEVEAVAVSLVDPTPKLSSDAGYLRAERPENLLRWDLTVAPDTHGEKAVAVDYQFKLEYARDVAIVNLKAKK